MDNDKRQGKDRVTVETLKGQIDAFRRYLQSEVKEMGMLGYGVRDNAYETMERFDRTFGKKGATDG